MTRITVWRSTSIPGIDATETYDIEPDIFRICFSPSTKDILFVHVESLSKCHCLSIPLDGVTDISLEKVEKED